jgi:hypothetical protein
VFFRVEEPDLPPYAEQLAAFKAEKGVGPHDILAGWCSPSFSPGWCSPSPERHLRLNRRSSHQPYPFPSPDCLRAIFRPS